MSYGTVTALGMTDEHEITFLFQKWDVLHGWSRGQSFDTLEDAVQEQKDFYFMREGTSRANQPTRILEVTSTVTYKCINQDYAERARNL